jgi:hypothetical protein
MRHGESAKPLAAEAQPRSGVAGGIRRVIFHEGYMEPVLTVPLGLPSWERTMQAVNEVQARLLRVTAVLNAAGVPYAVIGGNAVSTWVGAVDKAAVRFTQDVDILLRRGDLEAAKTALIAAGFLYNETLDVHMFLDGPQATPREAVHVLFAGEKVKADDLVPTPDVSDSQPGEQFQVLKPEALVRMKLTAFRDRDRVHLRDMIGVGLIDTSWPARFPPELAARLQELLDNPDG